MSADITPFLIVDEIRARYLSAHGADAAWRESAQCYAYISVIVHSSGFTASDARGLLEGSPGPLTRSIVAAMMPYVQGPTPGDLLPSLEHEIQEVRGAAIAAMGRAGTGDE